MAGLSDIFSGFVQGFDQTKRNMEESKRKQQMDKLQAKLFELSLKDKETQQAAADKIREMTIGKVGEIVTRGQKEIGGRQAPNLEFTGKDPMSVAEMLTDPDGQLAMLEAKFATPKDFAPSQQKSPITLQLLNAAGIDPKSPEGREAILADVAGRGDNGMMEAVQLQIEGLKLENLFSEQGKQERTAAQEKARTKIAIRNDFRAASEILQLQKDLHNTSLAVGLPYGEFMQTLQSGGAAAAAALGFDVGKSNELLAKRSRLNKLFAEGTIESIGRFAGTGTLTDDKFKALQQATPTITNQPSANALLLADRLEAALDGADIEGIDVPDREAMEEFIRSVRTQQPGPQGDALIDAPAAAKNIGQAVNEISQFTLEQIQQIDPTSMREWTEEQKKALDKRLTELGF